MRDFFYNKSDVLVAVLIIVIAAAVIYSRVGVIMNYGAGEGEVLPTLEEVAEMVGEGVAGALDSGSPSVGADENPPATPDTDAPEGQTDAPEGQTDAPADQTPPADAPPASVTITINAGDSADAIASKLAAAGAIADKQAFLAEVMAQGADSRLKMGTFTIPTGATNAEIIGILAG